MRDWWLAVVVMLLGGCSLLNSPRGILMGGDETPVAVTPASEQAAGQPPRDEPGLTITTKASDDNPRAAADKYCGGRLGYAQLVAAEHSGADDEKITWHFACRR